jgi:hypothetical protein
MSALQTRRRTGLSQEARGRFVIRRRVAQHELDGYRFIELQVPSCQHHAHPALTEHAFDAVLSDQNLSDGD